MKLPYLKSGNQTRSVLSTFGGINKLDKIDLGEWEEATNITTENYPLFSVRKKRYKTNGTKHIYDMKCYGNRLYWIEKVGTKFYVMWQDNKKNGSIEIGTMEEENMKKVKLIFFGVYLILFPLWMVACVSDEHPTFDNPLINEYEIIPNGGPFGGMDMQLVDAKTLQPITTITPLVNNYTSYTAMKEASSMHQVGWYYMVYSGTFENPSKPEYYKYLGGGEYELTEVLMEYSVSHPAQATSANILDVVKDNYSYKVKFKLTNNIELTYPAFVPYTEDTFYETTKTNNKWYAKEDFEFETYVRFKRKDSVGKISLYFDDIKMPIPNELLLQSFKLTLEVPAMDYVVECNNRLWGCRYDGTVNEIYSSALGEPFNWYSFNGLANDSYAASCGTPSKFTGACVYNNQPMFFKENVVHIVYPSSDGANQITTTYVDGVADGCQDSIVQFNGTLFYRTNQDYVYFNGNSITSISEKLGSTEMLNCKASRIGDKIYIASNDGNSCSIRVYDIKYGLWSQEDAMNVVSMASNNKSLYISDGECIYGIGDSFIRSNEEDVVEWSATSGAIGYEDVNQKFMARMVIRGNLEFQSELHIAIEYDSSGTFEEKGFILGETNVPQSVIFPIIPRRCDHFRIQLYGKGGIKIYSIAFTYEQGSDTRC